MRARSELLPRVDEANERAIFGGSQADHALIQLGRGDLREFHGDALESLDTIYHHLRYRTYRMYGYITDDMSIDHGREYDSHDAQSTHLLVAKRSAALGTRAIGCMRLILRDHGTPLPVEEFFPEVFADGPAPFCSTEVSRLISFDSQGYENDRVVMELFGHALKVSDAWYEPELLEAAYGVIDPEYIRKLSSLGVEPRQLACPAEIPYGDKANIPIRVDPDQIGAWYGIEALDALHAAPGRVTRWTSGKEGREYDDFRS